MDSGKNDKFRDVMTPKDGALFPKTASASPRTGANIDGFSRKIASSTESNPAWIKDAVNNRSDKAEQAIETKKELLTAKQTDPRAEISRKTAQDPSENSRKIASAAGAVRLETLPIEKPNPRAAKKRPIWRDALGLVIFVAIVVIGSWLINQFVIRSFNVTGPSMYPTLDGNDAGEYASDKAGSTSDRLIVNMMPVTIDHLQGKNYVPQRGQIIVFKNPQYVPGSPDEYVVKRVIGLSGETVKISGGVLKVYNSEHPTGFNPYKSGGLFDSVANPDDTVAGDGTDVKVPQGSIFVVGDHRDDEGMQWSMDSRNGGGRATLGNIPLENIVGPVSIRIWPLDKIKFF
jgi:signal peptidase I